MEIKDIEQDKLISRHYVQTKMADGLHMYIFTGVAVMSLAGQRGDWRRYQVRFRLVLPHKPSGKVLELKHWAPCVTLNSIFTVDDQGGDQARGWAVDSFRILNPRVADSAFTVEADIAVRDVDSTVARLGYNVTLLGRFVDAPPGPF